jgi:hypothetical protein
LLLRRRRVARTGCARTRGDAKSGLQREGRFDDALVLPELEFDGDRLLLRLGVELHLGLLVHVAGAGAPGFDRRVLRVEEAHFADRVEHGARQPERDLRRLLFGR